MSSESLTLPKLRFSFLSVNSIYFWALYNDELTHTSEVLIHIATLLVEAVASFTMSVGFGQFVVFGEKAAATDDAYTDQDFYVGEANLLGIMVLVYYLGNNVIPLYREAARLFAAITVAESPLLLVLLQNRSMLDANKSSRRSRIVRQEPVEFRTATLDNPRLFKLIAYMIQAFYAAISFVIATVMAQWAFDHGYPPGRTSLIVHGVAHAAPYLASFLPHTGRAMQRWLRCCAVLTPFTHLICYMIQVLCFYRNEITVNKYLNLVFLVVALGDFDSRALSLLMSFDLIKRRNAEPFMQKEDDFKGASMTLSV